MRIVVYYNPFQPTFKTLELVKEQLAGFLEPHDKVLFVPGDFKLPEVQVLPEPEKKLF